MIQIWPQIGIRSEAQVPGSWHFKQNDILFLPDCTMVLHGMEKLCANFQVSTPMRTLLKSSIMVLAIEQQHSYRKIITFLQRLTKMWTLIYVKALKTNVWGRIRPLSTFLDDFQISTSLSRGSGGQFWGWLDWISYFWSLSQSQRSWMLLDPYLIRFQA